MVQLGKEAEISLIRHNIGLVRSICWKFHGKGVPMEDLVDEGVQGLIHAMKKFKPSRGFRLSTYATWWIKQRVVDAVRRQGDVVR
jgi:RNA polymerase sigma factor (sigma-70 family)